MPGINAGPSRGFAGNRPQGMQPRGNQQVNRPQQQPNIPPNSRFGQGPSGFNPGMMETPQPVGPPVMGPSNPGLNPGLNPQPLPVGPPIQGPIDTGPSYMDPNRANIPNMNMGQNMMGGIRGAYGGADEGLSPRPFRRQLFY